VLLLTLPADLQCASPRGMTSAAPQYRKIAGRQYAQLPQRLTAENRLWRSFKTVALEQQVGAVTCINFSPAAPGDVAVTTSTRVLVYDASTARVKTQLSKFKDVAYSGTFRSDGKLVVAGGESGIVQVFELGSKGVLRKLEGHSRPVHVAAFSPHKTHIMSASDDTHVKWWDLATGQLVTTFSEHEDYVRCAVAGSDLWLSGSYDHTVKLWDTRTRKPVLTLNHGSQVESVQMFASGGVLLSAGGTELKVWDVLSGGRLLHCASNHQKTIQSLCLHEESSRLMSGGLDGQLKVYDTTDYKVTQNMKFPAPVVAQQLSPDRRHLVVGMLNGLLAIRRRATPSEPESDSSAVSCPALSCPVPLRSQLWTLLSAVPPSTN
jgi:U3 small nucleolar RNA-associated protein 15